MKPVPQDHAMPSDCEERWALHEIRRLLTKCLRELRRIREELVDGEEEVSGLDQDEV